MLDQITPVILTYNEAANIRRSLVALSWARRVLVIDSFSTDQTLEICAEFDNVTVINRTFDNFANQCNFALAQDIPTDWVMSMDADYIVTDALRDELVYLVPGSEVKGYEIAFEYMVSGKPLRGSLYPPRTVLYRKNAANYVQDGHAHRVIIDGTVIPLIGKIRHDDRKPTTRWLRSQWSYAKQEAHKLRHQPWQELGLPDKLRKSGLAPLAVLPYTLIAKGLILDGWPGIVYSAQRFTAELCLQLARLARSN